MSKNNEKIINNNFNPSKKRQDFKKHKSYGRCLTIEIPEDKCKDYYPKYANNKTINYSRSYNNFYAFKFNLDKINNNSSVRGNNGNQKTCHVPTINRHKRNLNNFKLISIILIINPIVISIVSTRGKKDIYQMILTRQKIITIII